MYTRKSIRELDKQTIRDFIEKYKDLLTGEVLDYGCGDMPYKDLILGEYTGYDPIHGHKLPTRKFDAILCTQVIQEVDDPSQSMKEIYNLLKNGGILVFTYNTHWEEYNYPDRWRFTKVGMEELAEKAGFTVTKSELRYGIPFPDWQLSIGYGLVAQKQNNDNNSVSGDLEETK